MNKEIKYLLEEIKDTTNDYVGTNGCLYQDLLREELNLLLNYISNLEQQAKKQKEVIDKTIEKLYCWGETLDPAFQKDLLDILKGEQNG